uniref:Ig-like domain-containing protein n=1 Tax=Lates calcarifer TaxID=8187 RepID=A0A4W6EI64_LATCA
EALSGSSRIQINDQITAVKETYWFTKKRNKEPVDLRTDSDYTGRVQYHCAENSCTLTITDLRESDSAEYKFRFITNQDGGCFTGSPGVTVSVSDLQVRRRSSEQVELRCHSSCNVADHPSYVWYLNGQKMEEERFSLRVSVNDHNRYSCAVKGHEDHCSPPVYPPKLPSVSVSPSGQIVEGSSVNLTCSSDANPAANYTWYKENEDSPKASGQIFTITDVRNSTLYLTVWTSKLYILTLTHTHKAHCLISPQQLDSCPEYEDITAAQTEDTEEQEDLV